MSIYILKGDRSDRDVQFCRQWLKAASKMRDLLYAEGEGFDPFRYNETATVGFLVAAAGRAGLLALPEFTESNRKLPEGRIRAGRCDLWIASEDLETDWLIEFKVFWYGQRSRGGLVRRLNQAVEAVHHRDRAEAGRRFGGVVYCPADRWFELDRAKQAKWQSPNTIEALADHVDFAFRFDDRAGPAYLLMKEVPPHARKIARYQIDERVLRVDGHG